MILGDQQELKPEIQQGSTHDKVFILIPDEKTGDYSYMWVLEQVWWDPKKQGHGPNHM
ncbi:hypothetical protein [Ammoniphilus sp. YIM 78166]|uniref:hypothetical protein n=1 Tax=Ammoniphilus sp. YIM 78166 TaxID=1644106 RepID=UPI00142FCDE6|nr:hypothetical protein [Ammoniphilus sp. YIM 78166]